MTRGRIATRVEVVSPSDAGRWRTQLPIERSVFGSVEFATLAARQSGHDARLFVFSSDEAVITYPLLVRSVADLPFAAEAPLQASDARSPEYTGPMATCPLSPAAVASFRRRFSEFCRAERIVAEFAHLHPWRQEGCLLAVASPVFDREIVYVDLTIAEQHLWERSFAHACRKNINRAAREKVRVFTATTPGDVAEFHRIYVATMERNGALPRYHFPLGYFLGFLEAMPGHARFVLAEYRDQVVAGTLYLHDATDVYSYLGGADPAFQHVRPTNAVVFDTIRWAQRERRMRLVLGGGYHLDDGIFRFKASFSPLRARLHTERRIHLASEHATLCRSWSSHYHREPEPNGFFPAYRATPAPVHAHAAETHHVE